SRIWKAQIPDFARRHRVATFDPRGNGGSDRPPTTAGYAEREFALDLLAVMDAAGIGRAVLVSLSLGAQRSLMAASAAPARVDGLVFIGPAVPIGAGPREDATTFDDPNVPDEGWGRYNRHSWRRDYEGFLTFFFGECFTEPHSTKQTEDAIGWGREIGPEALILSKTGASLDDAETRSLAAGVRCPTLVIQGDEDAITGLGRGVALAEAIPGARLVTLRGSGHIPNARDPVKVNLLIRDFVAGLGYGR
ncbi:MAG TPA: alpha/beta fold hydrolase, partial [Candidatus Limnocylindrales bacterium]|nr:alpha/beta fold hydrolase [Candidatus Limnocylindrales bacterium]